MKIRSLKLEDAEMMLEWMHSPNVVEWLGANFASKTLDDCIEFIRRSKEDENNVNYAISDENDEYLGTVSLKNIDMDLKIAEFAIVVREKAMGTGVSGQAMREIIKFGFGEKYLDRIYWCVNRHNVRAVKFYNKQGYQLSTQVPAQIKNAYSEAQQKELLWYYVSK